MLHLATFALSFIGIGIGIAATIAAPSARADDVQLLLATTTSVRDSGLLDTLLPVFQERTGIRVQVVAVGTGAALRMGAEGNADVLITHAEEGERDLVEKGAAIARRPFMANHFVIAGPGEDTADVAGAANPADAFRRIARASAPYVSRGDDSGTHRKELALFRQAGLDPSDRWAGFVRTGSGMGLSLQVAGEKRAYVLSDLGTFLAYRERIDLVAHSGASPELRNVYAVLRIDPKRFPGRVRGEPAASFEAFLLSDETQAVIEGFGRERYGRPLFQPVPLSRSEAAQ